MIGERIRNTGEKTAKNHLQPEKIRLQTAGVTNRTTGKLPLTAKIGKRTICKQGFLLKKGIFWGCLFMDTRKRNTLYAVAVTIVLACLITGGCGGSAKTVPAKPELKLELSTTVGSLAEVFSPESIPVEGYSIVGGLRGTGSEECPEQIREYLEKYINRQLPGEKNVG